MEINEQVHRVIINIRHITLVRAALGKIAQELERRALVHDVSKFTEDEFMGFVALNHADKIHGYGTPEYKAALAEINAVGLHTSRNSHHPEYHTAGIRDMGLLDLIEMVCDWQAASAVYGNNNFGESLRNSMDRFGLGEGGPSEKQRYVVQLIAEALIR
jgi:hypothetical protein